MRIAYCTNVRLPSERAHGHQIAKVTQALRELGHEVEIFAPYRKNQIDQSFAAYYGLSSSVRLHQLGAIDGIAAWWAPGVLGLKLTTFLYAHFLQRILMRRRPEFDLVYTRTPEILSVFHSLSLPVVLELHRIPRFGLRRFLRHIRACRLVVALTSPMRQALIDLGVSDVPVIVEGDGVDLHDFESLPDPKDTRLSLSIPDGFPLIVYAGQLESMGLSKGIPELIAALEVLHKRGLEFRAVIAGGPESVKLRLMEELPPDLRASVLFPGHLPHLKIPTLLTAADVLVYPAPKSNHPFYVRDTSPLKVFEYMAAGRPIVTADLPPIHDVLDPSMAVFFAPGNAEDFADAIRSVLDDPEGSRKRMLLARSRVEQCTWQKRMERIVNASRLPGSTENAAAKN
jgi:glycosyltransferase involved in cell wall biosynthesis